MIGVSILRAVTFTYGQTHPEQDRVESYRSGEYHMEIEHLCVFKVQKLKQSNLSCGLKTK